MNRTSIIAVAAALLSMSAAAAPPDEIAGEKIPDKAEVERAAKEASDDDCARLFEKSREGCVLELTHGAKFGCRMRMTMLNMAQKQRAGALFDVEKEGGKGTNRQVGNTLCRIELKKVKRKLDALRAGPLPAARALGPQCTALVKGFEESCFPATTKPPPRICRDALVVADGLGRESAEQSCEMMMRSYRGSAP